MRRLALILLFVTSVSCGGGSTSSGSNSTVHTEGGGGTVTLSAEMDPAKRALLEAAGGDAAVTVVGYPRHWKMFANAILGIGGELVPREVRPILEASGLWPALQRFAAEERVQLPRALDGWDDSRPIVAALFEPSELTADQLLARDAEQNAPPLLSHRVVVPASDPQRLVESMLTIARQAECVDTPREELGPDVPAAPSVICNGVLVVFETGDEWVRLRIADLGEDATIPPAITRTLDTPVIVTPALRWALEGPMVLAGYVRPAKLRAALMIGYSGEALHIVGYSAPDSARIVARAEADMIGAILRTSPVGTEVDDLAIGLVTGNRPTLSVIQGLTDVGMAAYDAGVSAPVIAEGPPDAPFVVRSAVNVDVMQAVAGVPLGMSGARSPDEALERLESCRAACYLHMVTSRVFGLGALADETGLVQELEEDAGAFFRFEPAELTNGVMMEMALDFPALAQRLGGDRQTTDLAAVIGVAQAIQVREGRTVMTALRLGEPPPRPDPARYVSDDPGPTGSARPRDEGAACAEAVIIAHERTLRGSSSRTPPQTDCPDASEELRALIRAWRSIAPRIR